MTARATKIRRMEQGLCYGCGDRPPAKEKLQCEPCLERQRAMWRSWHERTRLIEQDEDNIRAEALEAAAVVPDAGDLQIETEIEPRPGIELMAASRNVVRVCDAQGRPTLAILPWDAYRKLLRSTIPAAHRRRGRPRKEPDIYPRPGVKGGPPGRPPLAGAHILRELIRDYPDFSSARIADLFFERTGARINRNTVGRYRREGNRDGQAAKAEPAPVERGTGLVVNGFDLGEYDAMILEAAVRAGAKPESARESEQYADGLVGLYEAAEDFDPADGDRFLAYATQRVRRAIHRGKEERKVKVKGKSGRVLNFSEIGGEDFDISELIDDSGRLA